MSEIILTFQTQLSGVMETVFKAAIFEITRLVEDSFLEEVSRSREQVESLKKKLQWCESKSRRRCADCGNNKVSSEERGEKSSPAQPAVENARILKQERIAEESWKSCEMEKAVNHSLMVESEPVASQANTAESAIQEERKLDCMLKSEAIHTTAAAQLQEEWKMSTEVAEGSDNSAHSKTYSEQELQQIQNDWSAGLDQAPESESDMDHIQGLLYRSRYNMEDLGSYSNQELDMAGINQLTDSPQRAGEVLGFGVLAGSLQTNLGASEDCRNQLRNKRGSKSSPSIHDSADPGGMDCLLINEEGYLQDVSGLSQAASSRTSDSQGHQIYNRDTANDSTDCFYGGEAYSQPLQPNNGPTGVLGETREDQEHACTQCMISFPDQTQLSGVMETVLRSAVCEISRLVESSFLKEIGREKQEAEVLRRRLQVLESKLGEREKVKRVRCTECGRTGLSKKDTGAGQIRRQSEGAELICVTKQEEGVSEAGGKMVEKDSVTSGQEATSTIPDHELKTPVDGAQVGGAVKEEVMEASSVQNYPTAHCPTVTADHRLSESHSGGKTSSIHTSQPEHWLSPQRDKLSSTSAGNQDSVKQRTPSKKPEHPVHTSHKQSELTEPASSSVSPALNQQTGTPESVAIKQEVVVVLSPEWDDMDRVRTGTTSTAGTVSQARKETLSSQVTQPLGMLGKKQPQPAENATVLASSSATVRGHSLHKSPSLPKPSQALPHLHRPQTVERAVSALQTARHFPQPVGIRTHGHVGHHVMRTPHICSQCGKGFSHLCHLRAHQQIHTGERQFCCALCGRSFTKLSNLKAHRRVHTGERPYICMDCGKRFTQKCNLKRHQRIHVAHL
ncbi:Gastrula zinc finger protein XlCGF7.1 [Bagarius yarrelli]|uniref:Gastrula zinc finger protein XlCGF7.1 n=1 Tax=Bagarius yarrelli TaxID=175774 RepID=A0A556TMH8_BAGYA|nr:Gastrula zinc finger protein XlCGF7.1 [Bagarius yarrelli]